MADKRETAPSGPLAEGAERFDRLVRIVKDSQLGRTKSGLKQPPTEAFVLSPEEAWARKYTTHCIGPVCYGPITAAGLPAFAKAAAPPVEPPRTRGFAAPAAKTASKTTSTGAPEAIGQVIGKPVKAKSRLGRLFRRR